MFNYSLSKENEGKPFTAQKADPTVGICFSSADYHSGNFTLSGVNIRCDTRLTVNIQIIRPPLHHRVTGFKMGCLVDIGRPHAIALLMTHLALNGILLPQLRFHQSATGHRPESVTADISFSVIPHQTQRLVDRVFTHWFTWIMIAGKYQFQMAGNRLNLLQNVDGLSGERDNMRRAHFRSAP